MKVAFAICAALALLVPACGGDDDGGGDDSAAVDAGVDGAAACVLDPAPVECTVGDDSPCTAVCAEAYCYMYNQLPSAYCVTACTGVEDCPDGWTCNNMGRCRPPG